MFKSKISYFLLPLLGLLIIISAGCLRNPPMISTVVQNCLTVQGEIPPTVEINGTLVVDNTYDAYLLDIDTQKVLSIQTDETYDQKTFSHHIHFYASPDGQKLAYTAIYHDQDGQLYERMMLMTTDGQYYDLMSWSDYKYSLVGWFDNDRLLISLDGMPYGLITFDDQAFGTILLFNPFTSESELIVPSFLELYYRPVAYFMPREDGGGEAIISYLINRVPWFFPLYDPSLSRVFLYLSDSEGMRFALWDTDAHTTLWEQEVNDPGDASPQWSPNGDQIVFARGVWDSSGSGGDSFFSVDRSGREIQLTNLSDAYPIVFIGLFSWSPDGRYIAFWLDGRQTEDDYFPRLAILDMKRGTITDYCLGPGGMEPVWSPDGKQIMITIWDNREPGARPYVVIVDIEQNTAYKVAEDASVVGWMSANNDTGNP